MKENNNEFGDATTDSSWPQTLKHCFLLTVLRRCSTHNAERLERKERAAPMNYDVVAFIFARHE